MLPPDFRNRLGGPLERRFRLTSSSLPDIIPVSRAHGPGTEGRGRMFTRRAWAAAATALPLAMTGITAAGVAPAGATPRNDTTVTCVVIPATPQSDAGLDCVIADPDGLSVVQAFYPEFDRTDSIEFTGDFGCGGSESPFPYGLTNYPPTKIKLTIFDCENPRRHAVFVVRPDGSVTGSGGN